MAGKYSRHGRRSRGTKSQRGGGLVNFCEQRLAFVQRHEFDFCLNQDGVSDCPFAAAEHVELSALDVELEQVNVAEIGNVIQTVSWISSTSTSRYASARPWKQSSRGVLGS
jgi:hypothetical protein